MDFQEKKVALVLGGTNPHIALIENLKERGYYTVLIDYLDNPPAKKYADQHIQKSTLDLDEVLEIARDEKAKLVISTCIDQANATACYVAEKLNLPAPYSYETALQVTNKGLMKKKMLDANIPTSRYTFIERIDDFNTSELLFPVVVKPADSNGSAGVRKANNLSELEKYLDSALEISRDKKVIVEEFKTGIEVSIDCFYQNGEVHIIMIRQKFEMDPGGESVLQSPGSMSPVDISDEALESIHNIARKICKEFHLESSSLLLQAIINNEDVNVLEFAPRVGGGLSYRTVEINTGFDILDATVNSYLGINTELNYHKPKWFLSTNIIYAYSGKMGVIDGYEELLGRGIISELYHYKTKGMLIGDDMSTKSRVGAFLVKADTREEMLYKMRIAVETLEVYDPDGKKLMRKDIYDSLETW